MSDLNLLVDRPEFSTIRVAIFVPAFVTEKISLGINTHKVREVVDFSDIQKLPEIYRPYIGVINLRGIPIPILNLNFIFENQESTNEDKHRRIIICETLGKMVGIVADRGIKISEFENKEITEPTFSINNIKNDYINGLLRADEKYIFMLNLERILENINGEKEETRHHSNQEVPDYSGKHILIVEDSKFFQKKLIKLLKEFGLQLTIANNGEEGLEALKNNPLFDAIFSDIEMPLMNGIAMARKIKCIDTFKNIPIIFHSSISNPDLINEIRSEKLGDYMVKFNIDHITLSLKELFSNTK
jgi:two-component system, chemotaxis family, chemotaxis protein CheV